MGENYEEWRDIKFKLFWQQTKLKAQQFGKDCYESGKKAIGWVKEHPVQAAVIASSTAEVAKCVTKVGMKISDKKQQKESRMHFYDHSTGHYMRFKRQPKDWELKEANRRHDQYNEPYSRIYRDMNLI